MVRTPLNAVFNRLLRILPGALALALIASTAFAGVDMTIFGPKRYDRPKGAPSSYSDTFERCEPSDRALLRVTNGSGKETSITAGKVLVNGSAVFSESDFKNQLPLLEREITINKTNQLKVELKSGGPDTPFVIIEVIGRGCDSTAPSLFSPAPADGSLLNSATPPISAGYADDAKGSGIDPASVRLVVDGADRTASATVGESGVSFTPSPLPEGGHSVTVSVADRAANASSLTWSFTTDTIPPAVAIQSPSASFLTNVPTAVVTGTVSEPHVTVSVNGVAASVEGTGFTATVPLAEGDNTLTATASDRAGNSGSGAVSGTLDSISPAAPVLAPQKSPTNAAATVLSGAAESNASVKISAAGALIGTVSADGQGSFTLPGVTLAEGTNSFTATATDAAGNESPVSQPLTVVLDTKAPVVKITSQTSGQYLNTPTVTVSGTLDDPTAQVTVNGKPAQVTAGSFTLSGVTLVEGENTISVEALDPAGNPASDSIVLYLDTAPPVVSVASPAADAFLNTPQITVTGAINEPVTSVAVNGIQAEVTWNSSTFTSTFTCTLTLVEGPNSITVSAVDRASNSGTAGVPVNLDTVPPAVTITTPASGLLTKTAQVTVSGTVSEEFATVTVNNLPAAVTGKSFTLDCTLSEGGNSLVVNAIDRAANAGSASVTVALDSAPPPPPTLAPRKTPTNMAATSISGAAEAGATVKLFASGAFIGTLTADAQGNFTLADVTLAEGTNSYTATASDAAGNESLPSGPLTIVLDTRPPLITVASPSENQFFSAPQVSVSGTADEEVTAVTVNGNPAVAEWNSSTFTSTFTSALTLTPGLNSITLTATDLAGNSATRTVLVTLDSTPPVVSITAPLSGTLTKTAQVTVTGAISKANTTATVNGTAITVTDQAFGFSYTLSEGDNSLTIEATDRAGNKGSAPVSVTLDSQPPAITLSAPAEAAAGANVMVAVNAGDSRSLALVELEADGVPIWSGGNAPALLESVSYRLSPSLSAGSEVLFRASGTDPAGNEGSATATIRITQAAMGPGYIEGKALDDLRGLLMEGATVAITDGKGETKTLTTSADGGYFLELPAGSAHVKISKPGYSTVERVVPVMPEKKATALDARLTKINDVVNLIDSAGGTAKVSPLTSNISPLTLELIVPAGALDQPADIRLTPVSNQGLAGVLPAGWSPLAAADIRFLDPAAGTAVETSFAAAATVRLPIPQALQLAQDAIVTLAAYDDASRQWRAKGSALLAADGLSASAELQAAGQYALLLPDPAPGAPAAAEPGQPVAAAAVATLAYDAVTAQGRVVPQASPPATGLRAAGEVVLTAKEGAAPAFTSGLVLSSRITESFDLKSGDKAESPAYSQDIILYRYPCVTNVGAGAVTPPAVSGLVLSGAEVAELRTTFPVSPSKDYTIVELLLGKVGLEITIPDSGDSGVMVGTDGGRLVDADGNILLIPQGALAQTTPVATKSVPAATGLVGPDFAFIKAVDVNLTRQTLAAAATISIPSPAGLDPTLPLVVARQIDVKGVARLKLVALARQSGSLISSDTAAPGIALPGITTSGVYYFLQAKSQLGFVGGTVTDAGGAAFIGAFVRTDQGSLVDLSTAAGKYLLAAPVAAFTATAVDLYKNDEGSGTGAILAPNQAVTVDLKIVMIPPTVVSVTPAGVNIQPNVPVAVTFSKSIDQSSVNSATLKLANLDGSAVAGVFTFSVDGKVVTFTPAELLKSEQSYTVTVSGAVKDLQGYPLGSDVTAGFTVRKTTPPPMPAAGAISATFPDGDGFISVTATQGSAEPGNTVLLINDTSGEIVSVTPASNGSFTGRIRAQLGDEIKIVLMDYSGNQTLISYITYKSDDGKYLVTTKGGKVEGEGGLVLDIPEGALVGPTVVRITPVLQEGLPHPVPEGGKFLGAVNVDTGGLPFQKEVHLSIPLPEGHNPETPVFLTKPREQVNVDGSIEKVYEVIDSTKIINGKITTASPPFDGILIFGIYVFMAFPEMELGIVSGYTYRDMNDQPGYQPTPDGSIETPSRDSWGKLTYQYDQPVRGAVIRNPASWNYISYSKADGFYATFTDLMGNLDLLCKDYTLTAIHPLTMMKNTISGNICAPPYNIQKFNFKLADKTSEPPDKTLPSISMDVQIVPGQPADVQFIAGTLPLNAKIQLPITVFDQGMGTVTLGIEYRELAQSSFSPEAFPSVSLVSTQQHTEIEAVDIKIYRYEYRPSFRLDDQLNYFQVSKPGLYLFKVVATDATGNQNLRSVQVRVVMPGEIPEEKEGAPVVDEILPKNDTTNVMINTPIIVSFSEPVDENTLTGDSFKLIDTSNGSSVPSTITTSIESGSMKAILMPNGNLAFDSTYEIVLTQAIKDANTNQSYAGSYQPLDMEYHSRFTTKTPRLYDLAQNQFSGGRDIELFTDPETCGAYAYVTAGDNGYRVINVTDPKTPSVVYPADPTTLPKNFNYRCVGVGSEGALAMTENIVFPDGNQYGYARFYNLPASPVTIQNVKVGQEKLAEAMSGIPGRVAVNNNYAYIATAGAGLQIVDIAAAKARQDAGQSSDGSAIVGMFDSIGQGYGSPNDIVIYKPGKAFLTTNPGQLLSLDLTEPTFPVLMNTPQSNGLSALRIAVATDYSFNGTDYAIGTMDLAVTSSKEGKIQALDVSDPYDPHLIGTTTDQTGMDVIRLVRDIAVNKNSGVAFAVTFDSLLVIDIKDPYKPKLLNDIRFIPGTTVPIGANLALTQRDGWVYLASDNKGMRTMDFYTPPLNAKEMTIAIDSVNNLFLDKDGYTLNDLKVKYSINPPGYQAQSAKVILVENNNGIKVASGPSSGTGMAVFGPVAVLSG